MMGQFEAIIYLKFQGYTLLVGVSSLTQTIPNYFPLTQVDSKKNVQLYNCFLIDGKKLLKQAFHNLTRHGTVDLHVEESICFFGRKLFLPLSFMEMKNGCILKVNWRHPFFHGVLMLMERKVDGFFPEHLGHAVR